MQTADGLLDIHERAHRNLAGLITHCGSLDARAIDQELDGFGYPSIRRQLHHAISAERYWIGVLEGRIDADEDDPDYPTLESLEALRVAVFAATERYLRGAGPDELNRPRAMTTWGGRERTLTPAHVVLRTVMHLYHHQGQVLAMCRLLGRPGEGLDYPHE